MNNINYIYIIALVATLIISIETFIRTKKVTKDKKYQHFTITLIILILVGTILINFYYDKEFEKQNQVLKELLDTNHSFKQNNDLDSLDLEKLQSIRKKSNILIDSIKLQNFELQKLKNQIEELEKVIGKKEHTKNDIARKININNTEIGEINNYNEKLDIKILDKKKGYTSSGQSTDFIFECPNDYESEELELKLRFFDENLVDKIEYITISFSEKTSDKNYIGISNDIFKPQKDVNAFKVKNHFKNNTNKKINLEIGYTLKSEAGKEYPQRERIVCKNY